MRGPALCVAAFAQFNSIRRMPRTQGCDGNEARMPVLAIGGEKSFGANEAVVMRNAATDVTELVVRMPATG